MMHLCAKWVAMVAVVSFVSASPVNLPSIEELRKSHRIHQVEVRGGVRKSGAEQLYAIHQKYNMTPSPEIIAASGTQKGTVTAVNEPYDRAYLSPFTVGQQTLNVVFDTGSADNFVFSTELPASERGNHTLYQLEGVKQAGFTWSISYADGSGASGNVYGDVAKAGPITALLDVEAASSVTSSFTNGLADGVIGFGFDFAINNCLPDYCFTFLTQVVRSLPKPYLVAVLKHNQPGHYDFGFLDSSAYTGSIAYATVYPGNGYWEFAADGYAVGTGAEVSESFAAIADTGTSLLLLPSDIVSAYWAKVTGAKYSSAQAGYIFPCSSTLPDFSLYISGQKRTMPGAYANYLSLGKGSCYGGIQRSSGLAVIGDVFLKSQYVVFERATPSVGFAQQA